MFSVAAAVALLHAFDDAFLLPGAGRPADPARARRRHRARRERRSPSGAFPSLRPGLRSAVAFTFGALATVNGGRHAHHIINQDVTANDVTGVLALVAGVVLIGLAAWIPFRHRGEGAAGPVAPLGDPRARARRRLLLGAIFVGGPVGMALVDIHSLAKPLGDAPNAAYKTVHFTASDGVELEGWYRPSRNGASVLVISGGGSNRMSTLRHAKMLERQGYGVLVYDPRGMGHSEGTPNSYGWGWDKDVDAALDYLSERDDVDRPHRRPRPLDRRGHGDRRRRPPRRPRGRRRRRHRRDRLRGHQGVYSRDARPAHRCGCCSRRSRSSRAARARRSRSPTGSPQHRAPHLLVAAGKQEKEWGELYDRPAATAPRSGTCRRRATPPR